MAVTIRFSRTGKRGERKYRIVVKEVRSKRDGSDIDMLGYYEKRSNNNIIKQVDEKRLNEWISKGAIVSDAVKKAILEK